MGGKMGAAEEAKLNARIVEVERLALGLRLMEMEAGTTSDFLQGCVRRAREELLTGVAWARAEMEWAAKAEEERKQEAPAGPEQRRKEFRGFKALKGRKSPLGLELYDVEEEEK